MSSLPQLSLVKVSACREIPGIEIKVPNLQTFCYENMHLYGEIKNAQCEIYFKTCKSLKRRESSVGYNSMTLELLQNLSSKFPPLKGFAHLNIQMESIKISCRPH